MISDLTKRSEIEKLGFNIDKHCWSESKKFGREFGPGADPIKPSYNRKLTPEVQLGVEMFLNQDTISTPSSYKTTKEGRNIRHLCYNKKETFKRFKQEEKNWISSSIGNTTFRKCIPNYIKKPRGTSDMCPLCVELKEESLKSHKDFVWEIREEYKKDIGPDSKKTAIIMDFKENLQVGKSKFYTNRDFYHLTPVSCFGIVVVRNSKKMYYDFISNTLNHDTQFVSECLNFILNKLTIGREEKIVIWSDGCKGHFKNRNLVSDIYEISKRYQNVEYRFFPSYHGKNLCDSRFSSIARRLKDRDLSETTKILNLRELSLFLNNTNIQGEAETYVYERMRKNPQKVVVPVPHISDVKRYRFVGKALLTEDFSGEFHKYKVHQIIEKSKRKERRNTMESKLKTN